jgi:hypothetical protein
MLSIKLVYLVMTGHDPKVQIPSIIFQYILDTSGHITPGQISALIKLSDIPITLFPLLITIVVTSMSGMFVPFSRLPKQRAIVTSCCSLPVWRIHTVNHQAGNVLGVRVKRRYQRAVSLL